MVSIPFAYPVFILWKNIKSEGVSLDVTDPAKLTLECHSISRQLFDKQNFIICKIN
jgi:hypothetical protein